MHKIFKFTAALACIAGVTYAGITLTRTPVSPTSASPQAPAGVPVAVEQAKLNDVPIVIEGLGTVQALNTATLRTQVQGTLESVDFVEGQAVKRGQKLAQIDPRTYQAQLDQAQAALGRDQASVANAQADLQRFLPLLGQRFATPQQVDTQKAMVAQLQNTVKSDEAVIEGARTLLSYTTITAPFDGITGIRQIDPGNIVHPADATGLVVVTQVQPIAVIFTLPSSNIPQAHQALTAGDAQVSAYTADDKTELDKGRVMLIDNQADPATGTVRLKAIFPNAQQQLWPGTFVNIHLTTSVRHDGLTVPVPAVQQGPQGTYVFLVKPDQTVSIQPVTIRASRDGQALVDQGVQAGDKVVVAGEYRLSEGAKIEIVEGAQRSRIQNASTGSAGMLP
jgi:membrane fusion protein, multidrug efflux system